MVTKLLGYLITLVGIAGIALRSFPKIGTFLKIPATIPTLYITAGGGILVLIGIVLILKGDGGGYASAGRELPIYQGNRIVGYRRT